MEDDVFSDVTVVVVDSGSDVVDASVGPSVVPTSVVVVVLLGIFVEKTPVVVVVWDVADVFSLVVVVVVVVVVVTRPCLGEVEAVGLPGLMVVVPHVLFDVLIVTVELLDVEVVAVAVDVIMVDVVGVPEKKWKIEKKETSKSLLYFCSNPNPHQHCIHKSSLRIGVRSRGSVMIVWL